VIQCNNLVYQYDEHSCDLLQNDKERIGNYLASKQVLSCHRNSSCEWISILTSAFLVNKSHNIENYHHAVDHSFYKDLWQVWPFAVSLKQLSGGLNVHDNELFLQLKDSRMKDISQKLLVSFGVEKLVPLLCLNDTGKTSYLESQASRNEHKVYLTFGSHEEGKPLPDAYHDILDIQSYQGRVVFYRNLNTDLMPSILVFLLSSNYGNNHYSCQYYSRQNESCQNPFIYSLN